MLEKNMYERPKLKLMGYEYDLSSALSDCVIQLKNWEYVMEKQNVSNPYQGDDCYYIRGGFD